MGKLTDRGIKTLIGKWVVETERLKIEIIINNKSRLSLKVETVKWVTYCRTKEGYIVCGQGSTDN